MDPYQKLKLIDPLALGKVLWPDVYMYKQQREIIYSTEDSVETYVTAGNKLG